MTQKITPKTYSDAYQRAHEERAAVLRNGWNWLFSSSSR